MVDFRIRIVVDTGGAGRGIKRIEDRLKRTTNTANTLNASLSRMFGILGGVAVLRNAIRTLADFEQTMSTVRAVSGATEAQFKALTASAKDLGTVTRFSATQAGEGMEFLARAGFDVNEVLKAIGPTLTLAQAGALDLASAANIASNVLKGFRLEAEETGRVVDVLAFAAASSNTDVRQLGQALSFVAPIAASMGISLEEAAAAIGVLGDAGIQSGRAGRGLNLVLATLEKGSDGLAAALDRAGLKLKDIKPSIVGIAGALTNLEKANISAGEAFDLFGKLGAPAFNVLQEGIPRIREFTGELNTAEGTAQRLAATMDDNLNGALLRVKSAFQAVILEFGSTENAGAALRTGVESLAKGLRFLAKNIDIVINVAETLATVIGIKLVRAFARLAIAIAANPIGLFVTALTLGTAALVGFSDEILATGDGLTTLADVVSVAFRAIKQTVVPILDGLAIALRAIFGEEFVFSIRQFVEAAAQTFDTLVNIVQGTVFLINDLFVGELANVFNATEARIAVFGLRAKVLFFDIANSIAGFFTQPAISIAKSIQLILNSVAGAAAAAKSLGLITEAARLGAEDAVAAIEASISQLQAREIPPLFDTSETKAQLDALEAESNNTFTNIGNTLASAFQEGFDQGNLLSFVQSIFDQAEAEARTRIVTPGLISDEEGPPVGAAAAEIEKVEKAAGKATPAVAGLKEELTLLAEVGVGALTVAFENAGDALLEFAKTGTFVFRDFVTQLLDDIARLILRLLILQAIQAITGTGATGTVVKTAADTATRAHGGPVSPNKPFLVGEEGPELFQPQGSGNIVPANETAAMMAASGPAAAGTTVVEVSAPPVNVSVINQTDPNEFKETIDSGELDVSIVNVARRRKSAMRQSLGV